MIISSFIITLTPCGLCAVFSQPFGSSVKLVNIVVRRSAFFLARIYLCAVHHVSTLFYSDLMCPSPACCRACFPCSAQSVLGSILLTATLSSFTLISFGAASNIKSHIGSPLYCHGLSLPAVIDSPVATIDYFHICPPFSPLPYSSLSLSLSFSLSSALFILLNSRVTSHSQLSICHTFTH